MKKAIIELTRIEINELPGIIGANIQGKAKIYMDNTIMQNTVELCRKEINELLKYIQAEIVEETKILSKVAEVPEMGLFEISLASINRKTELYEKLHKALNNRYLD